MACDTNNYADQNDAQSWYLLGRCYMAQQKYPKAYEAYQQAVYRDGRNPTFWCSIGVLYYQINQYRDALDAYSRAIRLNPNISEVWYDLGTLVRGIQITFLTCHKLTILSTNRATIKQPTPSMHINGPLISIQPTFTSKLVCSSYRMDNPQVVCQIRIVHHCHRMSIRKLINQLPSMALRVLNGVLRLLLKLHRANLLQLWTMAVALPTSNNIRSQCSS